MLDVKAIKAVNFLLIMFIGGALSMGNVLTQTGVLHLLTEHLMQGLIPMLSDGWRAALTLYWGGFVYHFLLAEDKVMVTTVLPALLKFAQSHGYNPVAAGMIWAFAAGGKLFVYQSSVLIYGYSHGYFTARDLLKVAGILTLVEGVILMVLVPLYWPLSGLPWRNASPVPALTRSAAALPTIALRSSGMPEAGLNLKVEGRRPVDTRVPSQYNTPECVERARCPWYEAGCQNVVQEVGDGET